MNCSICDASLCESYLTVLDFHLCEVCAAKLMNISASRMEYDWYVSYVRRKLTEPMLQETDNIISINTYLARRKAAK